MLAICEGAATSLAEPMLQLVESERHYPNCLRIELNRISFGCIVCILQRAGFGASAWFRYTAIPSHDVLVRTSYTKG
jgi:hypothetical protein